MVLVQLVSILQSIDTIRNLVWNATAYTAEIAGKPAITSGSNITWFQSSLSPYDAVLALRKGTNLGRFTGNVYRSKFNGQLYAEVKLNVSIGQGYDPNETIWVQAIDIETQSKQTTSKGNVVLWLLALYAIYEAIVKK